MNRRLTPAEILNALLRDEPALAPLESDIRKACELVADCHERGGLLLCCGNGGSAADADHIVGEMMKSFRYRRALPPADTARLARYPTLLSVLEAAIPAVSLCAQTALTSAFGNDVSAEYAYAQQLYGYAANRPALLIALSTSGNAANVLHAAEAAICLHVPIVGLTGRSGGTLAPLCDVCLTLPADETYRVQEYTLPVYHALCAMVEAHFFDEA